MKNSETHARVAANATLLAGATGCSRVLGFVRDLCIAVLLGAGPMADAFFLAFRIPDLLRRLFGEGIWSLVFVPAFLACGHAHPEGRSRGFALGRSVMAWILLLVGGGSLACMVLAPQVIGLIAPGVLRDPEVFAAAASMLRICAPYAVCVMAAALSMALLNAMGHFLTPALAPVVLNCVVILCALSAWLLDLGPWDTAHLLAWGVVIGGGAQWLVQQPALKARGFSWRGPWNLRDREAFRLGRDALPVLIGVSCFQVSGLLATLAAASLPQGSVSWLCYAERLAQLPLGVFSVAMSVAALPELSSLAARKREQEFDAVLGRGLGAVLWASLPAAAGLAALSRPIVALLFGHGAFDQHAVQGAGATLAALALGLPAFALVRPLAAACNARQDRATPLRAALLGLACFGLAFWPCMRWWQAPGLTLAVSLAGWCNAIALLFALSRRGRGVWPAMGARTPLVSLLLSLAVFGLGKLTQVCFPSFLDGWGGVGVLPLIAVLAMGYVLGSMAWGLSPARSAWEMLRQRLNRLGGKRGRG